MAKRPPRLFSADGDGSAAFSVTPSNQFSFSTSLGCESAWSRCA